MVPGDCRHFAPRVTAFRLVSTANDSLYSIKVYLYIMPSEFLHIPPAYTLVGLYRLCTDSSIRGPVFDKVKHATIRGLVVGAVYAVGSWGILRWIVKTFLVGGAGSFFGFGGKATRKVAEAVGESRGGGVWVGLGGVGMNVDLVLCELVRPILYSYLC